jgi:c-di-GMP-binding flagellar brake protein YcgR
VFEIHEEVHMALIPGPRQILSSGVATERRSVSRFDVDASVKYRRADGGVKRDAVTKDISADGCLLLISERIPENASLDMEIYLPDGKPAPIYISGNVVRVNKSEGKLYECGVSFENIPAEYKRRFADHCFAKMYEALGIRKEI